MLDINLLLLFFIFIFLFARASRLEAKSDGCALTRKVVNVLVIGVYRDTNSFIKQISHNIKLLGIVRTTVEAQEL